MKLTVGIVLFLLFFCLAGVGVHYLIYDKPGLFAWSIGDKGIRKTKIAPQGTSLVKKESPKTPKATIDKTPLSSGDEVIESNPKVKSEPKKAPQDPNVISLFNGKDLGKWQKTLFGGEGDVFVNETGELEFDFGALMTGVHWGEAPPRKSNYEITFDAMKLDGNDFFVGLTFPVKESHATFIIGGWGGGVVGLSSVDDLDASENETLTYDGYDKNIWYKIRVRVTDDKIEAWIDSEKKVDVELEGRKISLRPGDVELSVPIGLASFTTRAKYRKFVWTNLSEKKHPSE